MAVEGAAQIAPLDQFGQFTRLGRRDLSLVLPQLGRNEIEAQRLVELLLVMDLRRLFRTFRDREAVFIERPSAIQRTAAEADIVFLASGEIDERKGELLGLNHPKVALDTILETDARLGRTMDNHLLDQRMMDEKLRDLLGLFGRDQDVEIADRLLAAAEAPPLADLADSLMGTEIGKQLLSQHGHHVNPESPSMLAVILDRFQ